MRKGWPNWRCILGKIDKIAKQRFTALFPETFRVPLHSKQREESVKQSFYHIVLRTAGTDQPFTKTVHCLMVGGIYQRTVSVKLIKEIIPA